MKRPSLRFLCAVLVFAVAGPGPFARNREGRDLQAPESNGKVNINSAAWTSWWRSPGSARRTRRGSSSTGRRTVPSRRSRYPERPRHRREDVRSDQGPAHDRQELTGHLRGEGGFSLVEAALVLFIMVFWRGHDARALAALSRGR